MKKLYTILCLTLTVTFSHAQWAGFNNNGGDGLWSNDANWGLPGGVTELLSDQLIDIYDGPAAATLDEAYTAKRFRMHSAKDESFTLSGANTLTIDIADGSKDNSDNPNRAIYNESGTATTLTFDCDVTIANTATIEQFKGVSVISAATLGSIVEFGASNTLNIGGTGSTSFWGAGESHLNGNITGTQGILLGSGATVNFGSETSDISGYNAAFTLTSNSSLTLNSNGSTAATVNKVQVNSSPATLTLEGPNVLTVTGEIRVSRNVGQAFTLDLNINANQTLSNIWLKGDGSVLNLNIDPSVTSVAFWAQTNAANWHTNATLNIIGYREGVIKFGADSGGLVGGARLANITIDGQAAPGGEPLSLDADGYLIGAASLALSTEDNNAFEFSMYPNPVKDVIRFNSKEQIASAKAYSLLGKEVLNIKQPNEYIDTAALNSGLYVLKLEAEDGSVVTRKFIKE